MLHRRNLLIAGAFAVVIAGLGLTARALDLAAAQGGGTVQAPKFEVDPMWPKPLPNNMILGQVIGVGVDAQDHVWIVHRSDLISAADTGQEQNPPTASCCRRAPPIMEFAPDGTLLRSWGGPGPGYEWPESNHGIAIDHKGLVWIGGNVGADAQILKFTQDGKFVAQYGKSGQNKGSNDPENFGRPAKIFIDPKANEAYIADGYGNKRVVVVDADTGKFKRFWGAYGNKPDDTNLGPYNPDAPPVQQFRNPVHCSDMSNDGLVYVCDRPNNRLQVFTREGKFVKEAFFHKKTLGDGAVWDVAFSRDPQQKYLYMADGKNERVNVLLRESLEVLTSFGDGGRQPGQFFAVHSIVTDSKGNLYTTETYEGRRLQKFTYKGIMAVPREQGVVWPTGK
ncbi:MAG TPA: hypothetical protein VFV98_06050 [Vicinamibacterales bacterium]|nr:hypothetical protein [Vicinamibacterales bacterium]